MDSLLYQMADEIDHTKEDDLTKELFSLVKEKLPYMSIPVYISSTGHIEFKESLIGSENCWCLDDLDRLVFIMDGILYYRRYEPSYTIVYSRLSNDRPSSILSLNEKEDLVTKLSNIR